MSDHDGHHWIAISDLLSGFVVVMILLFVGSVALRRLEAESTTERTIRERKEVVRALETELAPFIAQGLLHVETDKDTIQFNDSSFPSGSACLDPRAKDAAEAIAPRIAAALSDNPGLTVYVEGHTDAAYFRGEPDSASAQRLCGWFADNTQLSTVRAANVRSILAAGLAPDALARVPVSGWGSERLLSPKDPLASENRRVEIRYVWPPLSATPSP